MKIKARPMQSLRSATPVSTSSSSLLRWQNLLAAGLIGLLLPASVAGGKYTGSAHGSAYGVSRGAMEGYSRGNCAHCHEMHASLEGNEPAPGGGGASPFTLFARNFNTTAASNPYLESDNFCFYCHNQFGSVQVVENKDYSATFGGANPLAGPPSIMAAFNSNSYHNLKDIHQFVQDNPATYPWYRPESNPCNACHNPHLAKRNWENIPNQSAISKPSDHFNLWGESELISTAYPNQYEAPHAASASVREPAGDAVSDGSKTPDYVGFCTDCHNSSNTIWSSKLGRHLRPIDWSGGPEGEKHGGAPRDGTDHFQAPYSTAGKSNMVLSCLDCHEPHGSENIKLIRRRVNGGSVTMSSTNNMKSLCGRCHSTNWEYIHHYAPDRPYARHQCGNCHDGDGGGGGGPGPIRCGNCHFHGSDDSWAGSRATGRKT
ncbi:cytochrome c3 family protein, partial [Desulfurivibrio sp. D14AmB]|uniref:cytochrome c3 family protein n=1 Tax=Desulfurivibrio sp. D14AmB TaxID=3374370 RepID=UPI00376EB051